MTDPEILNQTLNKTIVNEVTEPGRLNQTLNKTIVNEVTDPGRLNQTPNKTTVNEEVTDPESLKAVVKGFSSYVKFEEVKIN